MIIEEDLMVIIRKIHYSFLAPIQFIILLYADQKDKKSKRFFLMHWNAMFLCWLIDSNVTMPWAFPAIIIIYQFKTHGLRV